MNVCNNDTIRADIQCYNEENDSHYLDIIVLDVVPAVHLLRTAKKREDQFYKRV